MSRGRNSARFGPLAFVDVFCCHCCPDLIQHSSRLCSECVLEKGRAEKGEDDKTHRFLILMGNNRR